MLNPMDLTGKQILVTGASSGIGKETAILISKLGANLIITGRSVSALNDTKMSLEEGKHIIVPFNLKESSRIPEWLKGVSEKAGTIDGIVHCAGVQDIKPINIIKKHDIDEIMEVNLIAAIMLTLGYKQREVKARDGGSIVFVSSIMAIVGQPGRTIYSASKAGIVGLTKSAALELARQNIRVNCVLPGFVSTKATNKLKEVLSEEQYDAIKHMHPLGIGTALDVAYAIAFLLSDSSKWITGSCLIVDGGYSAQ